MNLQYNPDDEPGFRHVKNRSEQEFEQLFNIEHDNNDDPVAALNKRKKLRIIIISALVIIALLASGFLVYRVYSNQLDQEQRLAEEEQRKLEEEQARAEFEPNLPLLDSYGDKTPPSTDVDTISLEVNDDGAFVSSEGDVFTHNSGEFIEAEIECSVSRSTDFCFAGELDTDDQTMHTYFLKNAPNSRLLEHAENFETVDVKGASTAAAMTIQLGGEATPVLVVVQQDGSGYMIAAPDASQDTVRNIAQDVQVS